MQANEARRILAQQKKNEEQNPEDGDANHGAGLVQGGIFCEIFPSKIDPRHFCRQQQEGEDGDDEPLELFARPLRRKRIDVAAEQGCTALGLV